MRRAFLLASIALALVAADASACGPVRGLIHRVRDRVQQRGQAATEYAEPSAAVSGQQFRTAPNDCPDGRCPLPGFRRVEVNPSPAGVVVYEFPRRMP